ncbi:MAG TPA: GAF domain-containing protein [Gaiellaceae bacterium]|nr:GAF domain-containing protein [Gaiellaceae bacterium]
MFTIESASLGLTGLTTAWESVAAVLGALLLGLLIGTALRIRPRRRGGDAEASARELHSLRRIAAELAKAQNIEGVARTLLDEIGSLFEVDFASLSFISDDAREASGFLARAGGHDVDWWRDVRVNLAREPSGIASAVFEATGFAIYDVSASTVVNPRLTERVGAKSAAFVPLVGSEKVIAVISVATTSRHRTFSAEDLATMQSIAADATTALERTRASIALADALARERLLAAIGRRLRSEPDLQGAVDATVEDTARALGAVRCFIRLGDLEGDLPIAAQWTAPGVEPVREEAGALAVSNLAAHERRTVAIADIEEASELGDIARLRELGARAVVSTPVVVQGAPVGVLSAHRDAPLAWSQNDLLLLEAVAAEAGLAIRLGRLLSESSRQARVQRGFYRIAAVLGQSLSRTATLAAIAQAAAEGLDGAAATVFMPRGDTLELAGAHGVHEQLVTRLMAGIADGSTIARAAAQARMLAAPSLADDERLPDEWRAAATEAGFRAALFVPVDTARRAAGGLVVVLFLEERAFTDDDLELAHHLADATRSALERSELFEGEQSARALAQQLTRTGRLLTSELDPAAVLEEVVQQAPALVNADACAIRVLDGDELVVSTADGLGAADAVGTRSPAGTWLSGDVVQSRAPVALENAAADQRLRALDPLLAAGNAAYLGVPLAGSEGAPLGVLSVYAREPREWREEEVEAMQALAASTSAALASAELYQRVAMEKERSVAILANIADGIVAVDRDGEVVLWNAAAEKITGVGATDALGRPPVEVLQRTLESGEDAPTGDRFLAIKRGREDVWLSVTEAVMRDPTGTVAGRIFAFRDISSDRLVEQMKSDFVSTVSHELRTPLTSIYGFAETLLRRDVTFGEEERRTFLGYIASESQRLTTIVDALLNVARLETGDLHLILTPTDVRDVVGEVVDSVRQNGNGHEFVVDLPAEPLAATADPEKLRQVFTILLENALKYSPAGAKVTVGAERKHETVEVSVADEGIGIPQADQEQIFRKFYRGTDAEARAGAGGTGLGLFIARGLVAAMGGRIWVRSNEGEGSTFAFELPLAGTRSE